MNRRLRNTILAFSVTGMMLALGLMAAQPLPPRAMAPAGSIVLAAAPAPAAAPVVPARRQAAPDALSERIDRHSRRFETEMEKAGSVDQAIAATAGFVAAVTTEAVLIETLSPGAAEAALAAPEEARAPPRKRRSSGARGAIAVPYFSFARGMGRGDRS